MTLPAATTAPAAAIILIVDDEIQNRKLLETLLRPEGYRTLSAANGEEALTSIAEQAPDLILLDIMMPGIDGYQLAGILKAGPATSNIPIIMVTALVDRNARLAGLRAGAEEFLTKPVDRAELWLRVRNLLRLKAFGDLQSHSWNLEEQIQARTADLQRFRKAMDATADAIMLVNRNTMRHVEVNATACRMLGYTREELLQMSPVQIAGDTPGQLENIYDRIIAGDAADELVQTQVRRKNGSLLQVEEHRQAQRFGADWIIVAVLHDITQRRHAEAEILRLNTVLEERVRQRTAQLHVANKELEAFSYSLSHDLRAPLSAIDGFSELLSAEIAGAQASARSKHYLARIRAGVAYMSQLIDAMLELALVSRSSPRCVEVDLSAIALAVLAGLQEREPARSVQCDIQPGLLAQGDPQLLRQVLDNLLRNAWKFSSKQPHARISFGFEPGPDGQYAYAVRDNGAGFDMTYGSKLFGAFQRLHTGAEFPGTGIGLATVHRIITRHGGQVWGDAVVGQGANFYFTLGGNAA
jgi:PAS domain S-box-containing protein